MIAGVCAGLAHALDLNRAGLRWVVALVTLFLSGIPAIDAGMRVVAFTGTNTGQTLEEAGPDKIVSSFDELMTEGSGLIAAL